MASLCGEPFVSVLFAGNPPRRPLRLHKALDYSCLQSNVARVVMGNNKPCFAKCKDGDDPNPLPSPSDCWLLCFFNTFLGNSTLGIPPVGREPLVEAWHKSFASTQASEGGCPAATIVPPPVLRSAYPDTELRRSIDAVVKAASVINQRAFV